MRYSCNYCKRFGVKLTLIQDFLLLIKRIPVANKFYLSLCRYKNKAVQRWLETKYDYVIERYENMPLDGYGNITPDCPIYVYWDSGFEKAPDVVKLCIQQIEKYKGNHYVVYLDNSNLQQYINLPDKIYEKYKNEHIGKAHYSDIVRFSLLSRGGGIWLDATVFLSNEFNKVIYRLPFYSVQYGERNDCKPCRERWTTFALAFGGNNRMAMFVRDFLYEYWKNEDEVIDYLFLDIIIGIAYDNFKEFQEMVDRVGLNNQSVYTTSKYLQGKVSKKVLDSMDSETYIHKLTYKYKIDEQRLAGIQH